MKASSTDPVRLLASGKSDRGSAMVVALLVMVVLSGLGAVVFTTATSNLQNAGRDRAAGGAMGVAEAGIAHAVAHIRSSGAGSLTCVTPTSAAECSSEWGYYAPKTVTLSGTCPGTPSCRQYSVWIQRIQGYSPTVGQGTFRVYSTGLQGQATRYLSTRLRIKPHTYPLAVFGHDFIREAGQTNITAESIFAKGCIGKRNNMTFDVNSVDLAHPELVPAAHSTTWISASNVVTATDCSAKDKLNIHAPVPDGPGFCNAQTTPNLRFDRDLLGGTLTATLCDPSANGGKGLPSPPNGNGSYFDDNALRKYGYSEARGLPASQYAALKQTAQAQGNYYDCTSTPTVPTGACSGGNLNTFTTPTQSAAIVYIKLAAGNSWGAGPSNFTGYDEVKECGKKSILLVVEGGDLKINSTVDMVGAIFVPDGAAHFTGASNIVGTVFAKSLFLNGSGTHFKLLPCFFDNMPGGLQTVAPYEFKEIDGPGRGGV